MIIIAGDFNINLNSDSGESTQRYKQILDSFSLKQHINKPTRKSKTLIDHIYSDIPSKVVPNDVLHTDEISDHDMPYAILNVKKERYEQRYKYIRSECFIKSSRTTRVFLNYMKLFKFWLLTRQFL